MLQVLLQFIRALLLTTHVTSQPISVISHFHTDVNRVVNQTTSIENFSHPHLTPLELKNGCKLGIDSYADTSVAGKHAHVVEFVEGKTVTARSWDNHKTTNLNIANVAYAYDTPTGQTIILLMNQAIYGGTKMTDSLLQPIQCLQNDVYVDIRPKSQFLNDDSAQTISFQDNKLPLEFNGPLPYLHV